MRWLRPSLWALASVFRVYLERDVLAPLCRIAKVPCDVQFRVANRELAPRKSALTCCDAAFDLWANGRKGDEFSTRAAAWCPVAPRWKSSQGGRRGGGRCLWGKRAAGCGDGDDGTPAWQELASPGGCLIVWARDFRMRGEDVIGRWQADRDTGQSGACPGHEREPGQSLRQGRAFRHAACSWGGARGVTRARTSLIGVALSAPPPQAVSPSALM